MAQYIPRLHILVDSREASVSLASTFYKESTFSRLGIVMHIRGIAFAKRFSELLPHCLAGDAILIAVMYLPENQLTEVTKILQRTSRAWGKIFLAGYDCFEHMNKWCLENTINYVPNPYKARRKKNIVGAKKNVDGGDESQRRIWVQYRLMLAIIQRTQKLGEICKQLIEGLPLAGDTLASEQLRAMRFFEQGEPDMAGGSYLCDEQQVPNPIDDQRLRINKIAVTDFNVLIKGDSGTGKETVAWAIHELSSRRDKPFFILNCAGLPEELLESEMFGYRKGSHNQADTDSPGILATADGGTLFLDELPEMSPRIQAKLLRFIESGEYRPVGGTENRYSNIRIIAAGQPQRLDGDSLRPDLKSRIAQLDIVLLPLWEIERRSPGTLYKIAFILLERYSWTTVLHGDRIREMTPADIKLLQEKLAKRQIIELLASQKWAESNIRQLNNFLRKWIVFGDQELQELPEDNLFKEDATVKSGAVTLYDGQLEMFLVEPKNREQLKLLFSQKPLKHLKKSYIRHLYKVYSTIIEQENEGLDIPHKPTQKELAKLMGVTENTISRHLN